VRNDAADALSREPEARQRIANEIGDVGIALMLLCDRAGIDLQTAMRDKLAKNRDRYPVEHAKGRATRPVV
jgi:NTP pyrophosphatase (non-canonical NTP hydrolase)